MSDISDQNNDEQYWYKDAIIYQLHVKAFYDTSGSGMGDYKGIMDKLDYLEDLGINAVWLLPFYPSPRRDDGYDISDYYNVHPDYGTLRDFRAFLKAAHGRGIRVITELVLNHTSDQHSWFRRARETPSGSKWRDYYVWSDNPDRYTEARIIFTDFETSNWTWDPVAKSYYWHRFYSHQPDLNYDNPQVRKEMRRAIDFWLKIGVDGLRLDAVPYLYEREGTNCENLPETYAFLKELRAYVDSRYQHRMLLAEANQWPEDAVAYFGKGDICQTAFHFPLMPRMYIALQMEDRFPIIDILDQTPPIPEPCQWIIFLRNHDELTLEMVTDEERDYMYRVYARDRRARVNLGIRRRLAPLLSNNRKVIELMNVLLLSLPGTPVIYYGDEIGMGDNYYLGDRNGVRTPMQWSPGKNAGFSNVNPQKLYLPVIIDPEYHYEAVNVETQQGNPTSLLWWMKRIIATRKVVRAFGRGKMRFLYPDNPKILAYIREYGEETVLVIVNLSQSSQAVELEISEYGGIVPVEIFSRNRFPVIRESPYPLTLGGYGYYWFLLEREKQRVLLTKGNEVPELRSTKDWRAFPDSDAKKKLEEGILGDYIKRCRWFGEKTLTIRKLNIKESIPVASYNGIAHIFFIELQYGEGSSSMYLLPISLALHEKAGMVHNMYPQHIIARFVTNKVEGYIYDALYDTGFCRELLSIIAKRKKIKGEDGELKGYPSKRLRSLINDKELDLGSRVLKGEQSNSSVLYEDVFFLKLYRKLDEGVNPDIEVVRFLTEKAGFAHIPPFTGALTYSCTDTEETSVCLLQGFVPNQGDAWTYTLDALGHYFSKILAERPEGPKGENVAFTFEPIDIDSISPVHIDYMGSFFLEMMGLLGKRTGQMHVALSSSKDDPDFKPEPFSTLYLRSLYQSMRSQTRKTIGFLKKYIGLLPEDLQEDAKKVAELEHKILSRQHRVMEKKIWSMKIRTHGDYHLGQVLFTGKDFVIIDFEGEPARALSERKIKRSPLRDVAGMMRSFHYAVYAAFRSHVSERPEDAQILLPWTRLWLHTVSNIFLHSYLDAVKAAHIIPKEREDLNNLLEAYLLEKGIYELMYELNNRPDWVGIPVNGLLFLLGIS
ncbi:MAG: alpha-amylase [Spirochaetes bacterium DG_61]|nr:MAG: alpha-amylase [Spirochaetes bacterium DG_61]